MQIDDIHAFAQIHAAGSISEAARRWGEPKASLSHRLRRLESDIRTNLFHRTGGRMALTEAGSVFLPLAEDIVRAVQRAEDSVASFDPARPARLRIGMTGGVSTNLVAPMSLAFMDENPGVQLDLVMLDEADLFARDAKLDFIVFPGRPPAEEAKNLVSRRLGTHESRLYASPDYLERRGLPALPEDLAAHTLVERRIGRVQPSWSISDGTRKVNVATDGSVSSNDPWIVKIAVIQGHGIGCFPEYLIADELAAGVLVPILPQWRTEETPLMMLYPTHRFGSPHIKALAKFFRQNFVGYYHQPYRKTDIARSRQTPPLPEAA